MELMTWDELKARVQAGEDVGRMVVRLIVHEEQGRRIREAVDAGIIPPPVWDWYAELYGGERAKVEAGKTALANAHAAAPALEDDLRRKQQRAREDQAERDQRARDTAHRAAGARRARLANAPKVEPIDRARIIRRDGSRCYLCGRTLKRHEVTLDHITPLARGGEHTEANLAVACQSCNSSKGARPIPAHKRPRHALDSPA